MQLRDYLPKTLFGRMLSIILVPMILVQVITVFIFYERHWDTVTRHMASQLAAEIGLLADRLGSNPNKATIDLIQSTGWKYFSFPVQHNPDGVFPGRNDGQPESYAETMLRVELDRRLTQDWHIDLSSDPNLIFVDLKLDNGMVRIYASRKRIFSSTSWTFFGWTLGSSILLLLWHCCSCAGRSSRSCALPMPRAHSGWGGRPRITDLKAHARSGLPAAPFRPCAIGSCAS